MNKRLCILQVTPSEPNPDHVAYFENKENCDFYFVTHEEENPKALKFCPEESWSETRDLLIKMVEKKYDYYALIDYDYILRPQRSLGVLDQIIEDLGMNPAVLTYYPGKNLQTPYATDLEYYNSRDYSCIPFTHFGLKIIHNSLIKWFFPLCTEFSVNIDSCHMFNIQEIPFLKNVICSHKMIYDNGVSDPDAIYNKDGAYTKYKMDEMWKWIRPSFKMNNILNYYKSSNRDLEDSLFVKKAFVELMRSKNIKPTQAPVDVDYYNENKISNVFELEHQFFINKGKEIEEQFAVIDESFGREIEKILRRDVTFEKLKTKTNPWLEIANAINKELTSRRNITMNECHDIYQKMRNNPSLFAKNAKTNPDLWGYLKDKRVAFVGPASYLVGKGKGELIDSYDVVVRIQPEIWNTEDFGSRTDIVQSCLNSAYSPKVSRYLENTPSDQHPKFIICNDTVAREVPHPGSGNWLSVVEEYKEYLEKIWCSPRSSQKR